MIPTCPHTIVRWIAPNINAWIVVAAINPNFAAKRFNKNPLNSISSDSPVWRYEYTITLGSAASPIPVYAESAAATSPLIHTANSPARKQPAKITNIMRIRFLLLSHLGLFMPSHLKKFSFFLAVKNHQINGIMENSNTWIMAFRAIPENTANAGPRWNKFLKFQVRKSPCLFIWIPTHPPFIGSWGFAPDPIPGVWIGFTLFHRTALVSDV